MEEEKEIKGTIETKRTCGIEKEEERDRLSDLPDCVLLHIMKFLVTEDAIRTCFLSKRWVNVWTRPTSLSFNRMNFRDAGHFNTFVSVALAKRDHSVSLLDLNFQDHPTDATQLLNMVMEYGVLHNVERLRVEFAFTYRNFFDPLIFSCQSLTFLHLCNYFGLTPLDFPRSLHLPALKTLFLIQFRLNASDNGRAEHFSTCSSLNTLVLEKCSLTPDAKELHISNSNLSSLKLDNTPEAAYYVIKNKIVLSTPNLRSLKITDDYYSHHQLSSTCNLSLLEEGNIHTTHYVYPSITIGRLQVFSNVKILTLNAEAFKIILRDLSDLATKGIQPPRFVRLELLKMKMDPYILLSDEDVDRVVEYLLQNSLLAKVTIINC